MEPPSHDETHSVRNAHTSDLNISERIVVAVRVTGSAAGAASASASAGAAGAAADAAAGAGSSATLFTSQHITCLHACMLACTVSAAHLAHVRQIKLTLHARRALERDWVHARRHGPIYTLRTATRHCKCEASSSYDGCNNSCDEQLD